jgi:5-methylcytosine-specific restriction endonuclease McrA
MPNLNRRGQKFDTWQIDRVWEKATILPGENPNRIRADKCGAKINRDKFGVEGDMGWEIDHVEDLSNGGDDELDNLQPLHWQNNRAKGDGDDRPHQYCRINR